MDGNLNCKRCNADFTILEWQLDSEVCQTCTEVLLRKEELVDEQYILLVMSAMNDIEDDIALFI